MCAGQTQLDQGLVPTPPALPILHPELVVCFSPGFREGTGPRHLGLPHRAYLTRPTSPGLPHRAYLTGPASPGLPRTVLLAQSCRGLSSKKHPRGQVGAP